MPTIKNIPGNMKILRKNVHTPTRNKRCCCKRTTIWNLNFFNHTRSGISKRTLSCNTPPKLGAILYNRSACLCYKCVHFIQHTLDNIRPTELFCEQLCCFPGCVGKTFKISFHHWWRFLTATSAITYFHERYSQMFLLELVEVLVGAPG